LLLKLLKLKREIAVEAVGWLKLKRKLDVEVIEAEEEARR